MGVAAILSALIVQAGCQRRIKPPPVSRKPPPAQSSQPEPPPASHKQSPFSTSQPARPASATPKISTPEPAPSQPAEKARAGLFDPERPCFSKLRMAGARRVLFNGNSPPKAREWEPALNRAFFELGAPCEDDQFLALVLTAIQMESGVRTDPPLENPDLAQLFSFQLEKFRDQNPISGKVLDYSELDEAMRGKLQADTRRGHVRTERELVRYVEQDLRGWLEGYLAEHYLMPEAMARFASETAISNPVGTLGPMQVNLNKAYANARRRGEPVGSPEAMRKLLLNDATALERGLKEGIYQLWRIFRYYRRLLPPREAVRYTAADYNAGEFSSRNAAFQQRVAELTGFKLALDGDLLHYNGDYPAERASNTESAVIALLRRYAAPKIRRDLLLEKEEDFGATETWKRVCRRFRQKTGATCRSAVLPLGAANEAALVKLGRTYTPANYARAYLRRWRKNLTRLQDGG